MNQTELLTEATVDINIDRNDIICKGSWTTQNISTLADMLPQLQLPNGNNIRIKGNGIIHLDTGGAWLLHKIAILFEQRQQNVTFDVFTPENEALLTLIRTQAKKIQKVIAPSSPYGLAQLGKKTIDVLVDTKLFFSFIGEVCINILHWLQHPSRIQWKLLWKTVENAGYRAIPIIALLSFAIGLVLVYQAGIQLRYYGANIFVVNLIGIAVLREFAPLMTAIILAGRSGSAFTAQIGTMQVNEEVDALQTMGINPIERLTLPKVIGLMIAMPLLTVWADLIGVIGGMIMSNKMLNVHYTDFLIRFQNVIALKHYFIGLAKAPVFGAIIACIGCYQGFKVEGNANSVGYRTTRSVVQSIFFVIIIDALFSILLGWYNL